MANNSRSSRAIWGVIWSYLGLFGCQIEIIMDQWGSTWFIEVYWEIIWVSGGQWGSVGVSGIYWASEGLGSFGVSGESLDVPIYHSRDLYILRYVVNINLMPEIYLEIEILRSVKMIKYNSFLKFVLNWIKSNFLVFEGPCQALFSCKFSARRFRNFSKTKWNCNPFQPLEHINICVGVFITLRG